MNNYNIRRNIATGVAALTLFCLPRVKVISWNRIRLSILPIIFRL